MNEICTVNKKISSYRRDAALQGGSVLAKCNWETIFCGHCTVGLSSTTACRLSNLAK